MAVLVAVRDLLFRSRIQSAADRLGVALSPARRDAPVAESVVAAGGGLVLLDLQDPGALDQIPAIRAAGGRVVAFAGHVQEELIARARAAGADEVLSRGQLVARIDAILQAGG